MKKAQIKKRRQPEPKPITRPPRRQSAAQPVEATATRIPAKWRGHWRRLLSLHDYLLTDSERLIRNAKTDIGFAGTHMADVATDQAQRDLDLSLLSAEQDALVEVQDALRKIREGVYGICELTGKPIAKVRLQALPWTRFAADAETELESCGLVRKAHLGALGLVETSPEALSKSLEEIRSPQWDVSSNNLARLEDEAPGYAENPPEAQPEPEADESQRGP